MSQLSSEELQKLIKECANSVRPLMTEESSEKIKMVMDLLESETVTEWEHNFKEENFIPPSHHYDFYQQGHAGTYSSRTSLGLSISDPDSNNHTTSLNYSRQVRVTPTPQEPEQKRGLFSKLFSKKKGDEVSSKEVPQEKEEHFREDSLTINVGPLGVSVYDRQTPMRGGETKEIGYIIENGIITKSLNGETISRQPLNASASESEI